LPLAGRHTAITAILVVAMLAFELFNFDTTRFALHNLLGDVSFAGIRWAAILALAFCAIDFAGLAHLCAPEREQDAGHATWYLMGAWLLGATMNALMTWWAINVTLLGHTFGNEVLSRGQILEVVPPFVAALVWLTRILFIGAFWMSGEQAMAEDQPAVRAPGLPLSRPAAIAAGSRPVSGISRPAEPPTVARMPVAPVQPGLARSRPAPRPPLPTMVSARTGER
jgi:hypothetical protein